MNIKRTRSIIDYFSPNEFKDYLTTIQKDEIQNNLLNINIEEREINIFINIMMNNGYNIIEKIKYITKNKNWKYKIIIVNNLKLTHFIKNQILLFFLFLSSDIDKKCKNEIAIISLYEKMYKILLKYFIINQDKQNEEDINIIGDIFNFNLGFGLKNLCQKDYIFNLSITYFVRFLIKNNGSIKNFNPFHLIMDKLYNDLLINQNYAIYFWRNEGKGQICLLKFINLIKSNSCDDKLKLQISNLLNFICSYHYSKSFSFSILHQIKKGFYALEKNYNKEKIEKYILYLSARIEYLNSLFEYERKEKKELYLPSICFFFDGSKDCGIDYNPNGNIMGKNFTLIFSFKMLNHKESTAFPLVTFLAENKKDILFSIFIDYKTLCILLQGEVNPIKIDNIFLDQSYLLVIQYASTGLLSNKIKIGINGNIKEFNAQKIVSKSKTFIKIGYLENDINFGKNFHRTCNNFNGIIGSILYFGNKFDEKDFIPNIFLLKEKYDSIMFFNNDSELNYIYKYENKKIFYNDVLKSVINFFKNLSKKIEEEYIFTICPLAIINSSKKKTNNFLENIYGKSNKKKPIHEGESYFTTLNNPQENNGSTYAIFQKKSIISFVENEGINILIAIIEYFYNLLRMLKDEPFIKIKSIFDKINDTLGHILESFLKIMQFFETNLFSDQFNIFGFSLKKLLYLMIDINILNINLIESIYKFIESLLNYVKDSKPKGYKTEPIVEFISKIFVIISIKDFFDFKNYKICKKLFRLFNLIIQENEQLIHFDVLNNLLTFNIILDPIYFDKYTKSTQSSKGNRSYKNFKEEYVTLLTNFIKSIHNFELYQHFLKCVSEKDIEITIKYKLMKIFYLNNNIPLLLKANKEINISNTKKKEKTPLNNNKAENDLLNQYQIMLADLLDISSIIDEDKEKYRELLKSIIILLLYEYHTVNIKLKNNNDGNKKYSNPLEGINFFSTDSLDTKKLNMNKIRVSSYSSLNISEHEGKSEEYDNLKFNLSSEEKNISSEVSENKSNLNKESSIFDILLDSNTCSFYIIKTIFICIFEHLNKETKLKFIKNSDESYSKYDMCMGEFTKFKKSLLSQLLKLIFCLIDENTIQKSLNFILIFMTKTIDNYRKAPNNSHYKGCLLHLFESKSIMNNFLDFCLNNENTSKPERKQNIVISVQNIINCVLAYHQKPFVFSYIKKSVENYNSIFNEIIYNTLVFFNDNLVDGVMSNLFLNSYLFYNQIRFFKTLLYIFEEFPNESQTLILSNNAKVFHAIQNILISYSKNNYLYDSKLYQFNPSAFIDQNTKKEKMELKIFQSKNTKILSNQNLLLMLIQLSLGSIYLLWSSEKIEAKNKEQIISDCISKLENIIIFNSHLISFYFDIYNHTIIFENKKNIQNFIKEVPENISKMITIGLNINYKNILTYNPPIRDLRIMTFLLLLTIMKYQSLMINYVKIRYEAKDITNIDDLIKYIKNLFDKIIACVQKDLENIKIINIKEDKKMEIIIEKEEFNSKSFNYFHQNFYKFLIDSIIKNKAYKFDNVINELEKKFILYENDKKKKKINLLQTINRNTQYSQYGNKDYKKSGITRKISFHNYEEEFVIPERKEENKTKDNKNINIDKENITIKNCEPLKNFDDSSNTILCTKRDLILKKFGFLFFQDYFRNSKFIKMKKLFFFKYPPENEQNNYHGFQKVMKNKFPITQKNFSNYMIYNPKIIFRPYTKFFKNKYFKVSHNYFDNSTKTEEKILHFEYGHGLLNNPNFNLFNSSKEDMTKNEKSSEKGKNPLIFQDKNDIKIKEKNDHQNIFTNESYKDQPKNFVRRSKNQKSTFSSQSNNEIIKNLNEIIEKEKLKNISPFFLCELITPQATSHGTLYADKNFIIYQTDTKFDVKRYETEKKFLISSPQEELEQNEKQIIIPYNLIHQIILRKFVFFGQALEIFLLNGKSYFFNLYRKSKRHNFIEKVKEILKNKNLVRYIIIENQKEYFHSKKYTNEWLEGKLSTLNYLLLINKFTNRSYNFLSQYLVLPWILTDFDDIYNSKNYRNFALPICLQNEQNIEAANSIYENEEEGEFKKYFSKFYSSNMYINNYLLRLYPFIDNQIKLQSGQFDDVARQIDSFQSLTKILSGSDMETMELIPEYFFMPEILLNLNFCFYGRNKGRILNNIYPGNGFNSALDFVLYHHININSDYVNRHINKWIDNIFGENQYTDKKNIYNIYPKETYQQFVKKEIKDKIAELSKEKGKRYRKFSDDNLNKIQHMKKNQIISEIKVDVINSYYLGQCPTQLFIKSHPSISWEKKTEKIIGSWSNVDSVKIILKNDNVKIDNNCLFMNVSSDLNYFYILFEHEIIVYNKQLKPINNLSYNNIGKIDPIIHYYYYNKDKLEEKINYMYKYLIFDIEDCNYFFIGGYLDNSFKIFYKKKGKIVCHSIYTDSKITCIKYIPNSSIFLTGHRNGKLFSWSFGFNLNLKPDSDNQKMVEITKKLEIMEHNSEIKIIEINKNLGICITVGKDEILFIRKIFDLELLNYIKVNKKENKIIEVNLAYQVIILSILQKYNKIINISIYSINGLELTKISEQIKAPICIIPVLDEIFIIGSFSLYLVNISLSEKTKLISVTNDLQPYYLDEINNDDKDICGRFNIDLSKNHIVSYFFDIKNHVFFFLFNNGQLYRMNLIKNL